MVAAAAIMLSACGPKQPVIEDSDLDLSLNEQTNKFLEENNIELPEGAARANLKGTDGTGVATKEAAATGTTITILADLPELQVGSYYGWAGSGDQIQLLGRLSARKGGYVVEKTMSGDFEEEVKVQVSRETETAATPTTVVLEGEFE